MLCWRLLSQGSLLMLLGRLCTSISSIDLNACLSGEGGGVGVPTRCVMDDLACSVMFKLSVFEESGTVHISKENDIEAHCRKRANERSSIRSLKFKNAFRTSERFVTCNHNEYGILGA